MSTLSGNIHKINSDWSFTDKIHEWIRNPSWQRGIDIVRNGEFENLVFDGDKVNFNKAPAYSTLWATISAANEDIGKDVYERISNFVQNVRDIETCNVHALHSIAKELSVEVKNYDFNYPIEIRDLVDITSIKQSLTLLSGQVLTNESLSGIRTNLEIYNPGPSGLMAGYDVDNYWDIDQQYYIRANQFCTLSGCTAEVSAGWSASEFTQFQSISASLLNKRVKFNDYLDFVDCLFYSTIKSFILAEDGIIANEITSTDTPPDSDDITQLKIDLGIPLTFSINQAADDILDNIKLIDDFSYNEQLLIQREFDNRAQQQLVFGDKRRRYRYERDKKVRRYIKFVEDLNIYLSNFEPECGYINASILPNFLEDPLIQVSPGVYTLNPSQESMVRSCSLFLRNIILEVSYQREYLKQSAQKHVLIGTEKLINTLIEEYIFRNFTAPEWWGYSKFPQLSSGPQGIIQNISVTGVPGSVDVIEYYDTTNYLNVSGVTDLSSTFVNPRYWEDGILSRPDLLSSEHTSGEIIDFYRNLGIFLDVPELSAFLDTIYDMGAVTATVTPTFEAIPVVNPVSGTWGEWGAFEGTNSTATFSITGNIEPDWQYADNVNTVFWENSYLLKNLTRDEILDAWIQTPVLSTWQTDITVSSEFIDDPKVQAWIDTNYGISGWLVNFVTSVWRSSDLIAQWGIELFKQRWDETVQTYGLQDAILSGWKDVNLLNDSELSWSQIPSVKTWLDSNPNPSQSQWEASPFINQWEDYPFTSGIVDNDFVADEDWKDSPFVSGWFGKPFDIYLANSGIISAGTDFLVSPQTSLEQYQISEILANAGAIPGPDGGMNRDSIITGNSLSGMFKKYIAPSGDFPAVNLRNQVHPSIAFQPYLWNLRQIPPLILSCLTPPLLRSIRTEQKELEILSDRINEFGSSINHWKNNYDKFQGYITFYENATNIDISNKQNIIIDRDGPWHWEALSAFIIDPNTFIQEVSGDISPYYNHLQLNQRELTKIAGQLEEYKGDIFALSGQVVYQYATDKYQNHYTLFKKNRLFDDRGRVWIRFRNHPMSFPMISYNLDFELSQVDAVINNMQNLPEVVNNCHNFDFMNNKLYFMAFGGGDLINSSHPLSGKPVYTTYRGDTIGVSGDSYVSIPSGNINRVISSVSGFVSIAELQLERFWYDGNRVKLIADKDDVQVFEGWDLDQNDKFIGWYNYNDLMGMAFLTNSEKWFDHDYLIPTNRDDEYNPAISGTYTGKIVFNMYKPSSTIFSKSVEFTTPYDEFKLPLDHPEFHNQWKLTKHKDGIIIAFESEGPGVSGEFWNYQTEDQLGFYDPTLNKNCGMCLNTITTIDLDINLTRGYGIIPQGEVTPPVEHFYKYTKVGHTGINAYNGTLGFSSSSSQSSSKSSDTQSSSSQSSKSSIISSCSSISSWSSIAGETSILLQGNNIDAILLGNGDNILIN